MSTAWIRSARAGWWALSWRCSSAVSSPPPTWTASNPASATVPRRGAPPARLYPQAEPFAMHVKGLEMPAYHPNAAKGTALAYAVSERGACHLRGAPLGELFSGAADPLAIEGKPQLFRDHQADRAVWNSACLCYFPSYGMKLKELWQLITAATGFDYPTAADLELLGERVSTLARLFNVREGFSRPQDTLPARNLSIPMTGGPADGQVVELTPMLDEYYRIMGWDENGIPSPKRLHQLNIYDR